MQVNVCPGSDGMSLGHFAELTFTDEVERLLSMPSSTWLESTMDVLSLACVADIDSGSPLLEPQPTTTMAAARRASAARAVRPLIRGDAMPDRLFHHHPVRMNRV